MVDVTKLSPKEREVFENLKEVTDPEFGHSIAEKELIDAITVQGNSAKVTYHLTVPFCPMPFALYIGRQIRKKAKEVAEIEQVQVEVKDHMQAEMINNILQKERS
jgi:metal-sulfur cluster biosynthetic enzyme